MAKTVAKKPTAAMKKLQRQIADRERRFQKMTKPRKRVAVARDVIDALTAKKLKAKQGNWVDLKLGLRAECNLPEEKQLRDVIVDSGKTCTACALGAMFVCAVMRQDALTVGEVKPYQFGELDLDYDNISYYLQSFFTEPQLEMIEAAFEKGNGAIAVYDGDDFSDKGKAVIFGKKHKAAEDRMIAIMQNIVDNAGTFVP